MTIGEEVLIHGYIDEIRKDIAIIRNEGGYFGTVPEEIRSSSEIPNTCGDAISREAAIRAIEALQRPIMREESNYYQFKFSGMSEALGAVENLPSVTPQQRTGRWIEVIDETDSLGNKVCEWFEQYVDIATDIVELRFSDGTVKKAKRGLYLRDIEKSIRKMMIDQIANEKKQESKWIPVSERVPEDGEEVLCCLGSEEMAVLFRRNDWGQDEWVDGGLATGSYDVIAWMPLPKPYKAESEADS